MLVADLLALVAAATPIPERTLKPSGPWRTELQGELCLLTRQYGEGLDQSVVGFQPIIGTDVLQLIVLEPQSLKGSYQGAAYLRSENIEKNEGTYLSVNLPNSKWRILKIFTKRASFDDLLTSDRLRISTDEEVINVELAHLDFGKSVLEKCQRQSYAAWAVNPAELMNITRATPAKTVKNYFPDQAYPGAAQRTGQYGTTRVLLRVDDSGKVTKCSIVAGAGETLDSETCTRASKIPFEPARTVDGKAVVSLFLFGTAWRLQ